MIKGNEIRIKVPEKWDDADTEVAFDRMTRMLSYGQNKATAKTDGYDYSLDDLSNDWWGKFDRETRELVVAYRYGFNQEDVLSAFEIVICWIMGIKKR